MHQALLLISAIAVNVPLNAGFLWLACRFLHPRKDPVADSPRYVRVLGITGLIFLVGWLGLLALLGIANFLLSVQPSDAIFWILPALGVVIPLVILKITLGYQWLRTLIIWVIWRVSSLIQFALVATYWIGWDNWPLKDFAWVSG
ncbi:MAG: hypothetical protein ACKO23_08105 [Gemmataceae bacterium]